MDKEKRMMNRCFLWVVSFIALVVLIATACGPQAAPTPPPAPAATKAPEAVAPTPTAKKVAKEPTLEERTLIVAVSNDIATLDWDVSGAFPRMTETQVNVLGRLADYAPIKAEDGTMVGDPYNFEPMLAESFEVSDDGLEWTFHLRKGLKHYPSGNPITAEDYLYYKQRRAGVRGRPSSLDFLVHLADEPEENWFKGFQVIDDYTLRFKADAWTPILRPWFGCCGLSFLIDKKAYEEAGRPDDDPWGLEFAKTNMPSSGAYYIESRTPGEMMTFRANPNWPLDPPFFERVIFKVVPESSDRVLLLRTGEVDIAQDLSAKEIKDLRGEEGVKIVQVRIGDLIVMMINHEMKPFDDVRVRRAVSYMMPYDDIIEKVWYGSAERSNSPVPAMVEGSDFSHWPYDVPEDEAIKKAKELMTEAGYPDGVEFDLSIDLGTPEQETMAKLIQGHMAKAGIKVNVNPMPRAAYQQGKNEATHVAFLDTLFPWTPEPGYFMDLLLGCKSYGYRYSRICVPEADELVKQAGVTQDEAKRFELYSEAQRLYIEDASTVWIGARYFNLAMRDDIQGYIAFPDTRTRYWHLRRGTD